MERHEDAWPFKAPVSKEDVPDYYEIIKVISIADLGCLGLGLTMVSH